MDSVPYCKTFGWCVALLLTLIFTRQCCCLIAILGILLSIAGLWQTDEQKGIVAESLHQTVWAMAK